MSNWSAFSAMSAGDIRLQDDHQVLDICMYEKLAGYRSASRARRPRLSNGLPVSRKRYIARTLCLWAFSGILIIFGVVVTFPELLGPWKEEELYTYPGLGGHAGGGIFQGESEANVARQIMLLLRSGRRFSDGTVNGMEWDNRLYDKRSENDFYIRRQASSESSVYYLSANQEPAESIVRQIHDGFVNWFETVNLDVLDASAYEYGHDIRVILNTLGRNLRSIEYNIKTIMRSSERLEMKYLLQYLHIVDNTGQAHTSHLNSFHNCMGRIAQEKSSVNHGSKKVITYSLSESIPKEHAQVWKKALSESLGFVELRTADQTPENTEKSLALYVLSTDTSTSLLDGPDGKQLQNYFKSNATKLLAVNRLLRDVREGPILARGAAQHAGLQKYLFEFADCSLNSLGLKPVSFVVASKRDCQELFLDFNDPREQEAPWLIKHSPKQCAEKAQCSKDSAPIFFVRGLKQLREAVGDCAHGSFKPIQLERSVLRPLIIDSRRVKLHTFIFISAIGRYWTAYAAKGFVTASQPVRKTYAQSEDSWTGAAVGDVETLRRETTNIKRQKKSLQNTSAPIIWNYTSFMNHLKEKRFTRERYLNMWETIKLISQVVVEASIAHDSRKRQDFTLKNESLKTKEYQIIRLEFWLDKDLKPLFHHGSGDLSFLLDDHGPSYSWLRDSMSELFAQATALALRVPYRHTAWEVLVDRGGGCSKFIQYPSNPCARPFNATQSINNPGFDDSIKPSDQIGTTVFQSGQEASAVVHFPGVSGDKPGSKSNIPLGRRNPHKPLDQL